MAAVTNIGNAPTQAEFHEAITNRSDCWYAACLKITRNPDMAADAVQDALLNAWNKRQQFERSAKLDTWIHRIAINAALNQIRKNKPGIFEPLEEEIEGNAPTPQRLHEEREVERHLSSSLSALTDVERICFVLRHLEQWRGKEIANEMAMNEGQVKQAVYRAVKKLRISMRHIKREQHG